MSTCNHTYKLIPEHQYVVLPIFMSFTEKTTFIKRQNKTKKKKQKKKQQQKTTTKQTNKKQQPKQ